jgi:hypothetical protein
MSMRTLLLPLFALFLFTACTTAQPAIPPTVAIATSTSTREAVEPTNSPIATETVPLPTPSPAPTLVVPTETPDNFLDEIEVLELPLGAPLDEAEAEISGMAWHNDMLVLLPQFPERYDGQLFGVPKADIEAHIASESTDPLTPLPLAFDDSGLHESIPGFEGFEAIAFSGNQIFVTIEARRTITTMTGYLVAGEATASGSIRLNPDTLTELPAPVPLENYSDEAITIAGGTLYTFYEANGATVNPNAVAHAFSLPNLEPQPDLSLTSLEYRLTDATPADTENRFWVINYLFPGDIAKLRVAEDAFKAEYGEGESHSRDLGVERLIQMEITDTGIEPTNTPPLYLQLELGNPRNWEGIVALEGEGFLVVTDKFPGTLLGFVAYSE